MIHIGIDPGAHTGFAVWSSTTREFVEIETLRIDAAILRVLHHKEMMGAGSVKRDSAIWEGFLKAHGIKYWAKPPQKGATKWEEEQFKAVIGWKGRTSEHARDAALLVWGM